MPYICVGALQGPYGLAYISNASLLTNIAEFCIVFLLFLLGLDVQPKKLSSTLHKTFLITLSSSIVFILLSYYTGLLFGAARPSLVIEFSVIFSNTIIGIKLLPTTVLNQKHIRQLMMSILPPQNLMTIFLIIFLGVALATDPIPFYIADRLKPIRDFFLILTFFTLGAQFKLLLLLDIFVTCVELILTVLTIKPIVFRYLLKRLSERDRLA